MADRYTYLPGIGLTVAAVWGIGALLAKRTACRPPAWRAVVVATVLAPVAVALSVATVRQERHWHDTASLFAKALDADEANPLAHSYLGAGLAAAGDQRAAEGHFRRAIELKPGFIEAHYNLANSLARTAMERAMAGDSAGAAVAADEAVREYRTTMRLEPTHARSRYNLGALLARAGNDRSEAAALFAEAVRLDPDFVDARVALATSLAEQGRLPEAAEQVGEALTREPSNARAARLAQRLGMLPPPGR